MAHIQNCECGEAFSLADNRVGEDAKCPQCGRQFPLSADAAHEGRVHAGRRRPKLFGATVIGAVILIGAAVALLSAGTALPDPPEEMGMIPAGATVLGGLNVAKMQASPQFAEVAALLEDEPAYARLKEAGLTLDSVRSLYFAVDMSRPLQQDDPSFLLVMRNAAPIDLDKLADAVEAQEEAMIEKRSIAWEGGEYEAFAVSGVEHGVDGILASPRADLLFAGAENMVTRAMALTKGQGDSALGNEKLMSLIERGARPEMFWFGALLPADDMRELGQQMPILPVRPEQIEGILVSVGPSAAEGVVLGVSLMCESEPVAEVTLPAMQTLVMSMGQAFLELEHGAFAFSRAGRRVSIKIEIPKDAADRLTQQAAREARRLPGRDLPRPAPEIEPAPGDE